MSVHNAHKYLIKSIKSILNQTLGDFEFVIINDASNDNSRKLLKGVIDKRIIIIDNNEKIGLTKSLNIAIKNSKGKYIARIDADDVALPERLEKQVSYLKSNSETGLIGTSFYEINENDDILGEVHLPENDDGIRKKIFKVNPFLHSSVMIPRVVFEKVGCYNEIFQYAQDYELWFRVLENYKGANVKDLLMKRRKHSETLTQNKLKLQFHFAYEACVEGINHIRPSFIDQFRIQKYKMISKMPSSFVLMLNKLRPHNLKSYSTGYYIRDLRS